MYDPSIKVEDYQAVKEVANQGHRRMQPDQERRGRFNIVY